MTHLLRRIATAPEPNVALFAFLLNLPWEFWQVPFYRGMADISHWAAVKRCTAASVGDAALALLAFWGVAAFAGRRWPLRPGPATVLGFVGVGLAATVLLEWLFTGPLDRWAYAERMPTLPLVGTGLLPVLQWTLLPPLVVWLVRRQLASPPPTVVQEMGNPHNDGPRGDR